jgi:hypothetical protein
MRTFGTMTDDSLALVDWLVTGRPDRRSGAG